MKQPNKQIQINHIDSMNEFLPCKINYHKPRHFLSITDFSESEIVTILGLAKKVKSKSENFFTALKQKTLAMIFEKPSLRTKLSFEIAMTQLGGRAVYLGPDEIGLGKRESIHDVSRVTSSMAEFVMARTFSHASIEELARWSSVPVINGLSDREHPCQTLADLLTIWEVKGTLKNIAITYIGDGENNVVHSLCLGAALLGIDFTCISPQGFWMNREVFEKAVKIAKKTGAVVQQSDDMHKGINSADVIYTDTWISMGEESEKNKRIKIFRPYQINESVIKHAKQTVHIMHDMPIYRGNEITSEIVDGQRSVIIQQAENRLHAQKALLLFLDNQVPFSRRT